MNARTFGAKQNLMGSFVHPLDSECSRRTMVHILRENPILLLFVVASIGYLIGNIRIRGSSMGVSAVLFTGLFIGAVDASLHIPEIILLLGLVYLCVFDRVKFGAGLFQCISQQPN